MQKINRSLFLKTNLSNVLLAVFFLLGLSHLKAQAGVCGAASTDNGTACAYTYQGFTSGGGCPSYTSDPAGTCTFVRQSGMYCIWNCTKPYITFGSGGGAYNGACGAIAGGSYTSTPMEDYDNGIYYCDVGGTSIITGTWNWSCKGINGGSTAYCSANKITDNGCAANTCNNTTCWNNISWVNGTKVCADNSCAANTCTTATCWNNLTWIAGTKLCDNGCAANTCSTTTCWNGIATVQGTKLCDNGCAANTCNNTTCWNNISWVTGTKVCADNSCAANICTNQTCWNNLAWISGTKPPTFNYLGCTYSDSVDCSKIENCAKIDTKTPSACLGVNSCTGATDNRPLSECSGICSTSTIDCPPCPLETTSWKEVAPQ